MMGQCIELHQGEIEELTLDIRSDSVSIVGLAPALRRLKVIRINNYRALTSQQIGVLSCIAADCDTLEEFVFGYTYNPLYMYRISTHDFKAICQLLSTFPSLKRVTRDVHDEMFDWHEEGRLTAILEMVKTSKTIEHVPPFTCGNAEEQAAIQHHCRNNMMHNQIKLIRRKGLLAANVSNNVWSLILKEFSDMPDVLYYLLHEKNGAMIGPARHG